jgi:glycoprotein-N-acetylgalactosamine 3-beta-galactosyltransferase
MWTYVYDHFLDDYDYFFIGGDDVYMAVENLRSYLAGPEVQRLMDGYIDSISARFKNETLATSKLRPRPLLMSTPMMWRTKPVIAGGAGYLLNQASLQIWGKHGADYYETDLVDSKEDFLFGYFLANQGVYMSDTQDEFGGCRFCSGAEFSYNFDGIRSPVNPRRLKNLFGLKIRSGIDYPSEQQISFHLKDDKPHLQRLGKHNTVSQLAVRYHALLYKLCEERKEETNHK